MIDLWKITTPDDIAVILQNFQNCNIIMVINSIA